MLFTHSLNFLLPLSIEKVGYICTCIIRLMQGLVEVYRTFLIPLITNDESLKFVCICMHTNCNYSKTCCCLYKLAKLRFSRRQTTHKHDTHTSFCCCSLQLDPMTSIYELDVDSLEMYLGTKSEVTRSRPSNVPAQAEQLYRQTRLNILPRRIRGW